MSTAFQIIVTAVVALVGTALIMMATVPAETAVSNFATYFKLNGIALWSGILLIALALDYFLITKVSLIWPSPKSAAPNLIAPKEQTLDSPARISLEFLPGYEWSRPPTESESILHDLGLNTSVYDRYPLLITNNGEEIRKVSAWVTDISPMPSRIRPLIPFRIPVDDGDESPELASLKKGIPRRFRFISYDKTIAIDQFLFCTVEHGEIEPFGRGDIFKNFDLYEEYTNTFMGQPIFVTVKVDAEGDSPKEFVFQVTLDQNARTLEISRP